MKQRWGRDCMRARYPGREIVRSANRACLVSPFSQLLAEAGLHHEVLEAHEES